ncbi:MAG: 1-acyl-sn-glycerol-3-phosphate acyltransferase [Clostridiales bacterium]|jgi:1-acyl-sn-glycerol-3-phosphate acyltransferase|nr:1-acyl-sn-glycerol-3-phosphate acyltransferase [Clostridiales bacterium]
MFYRVTIFFFKALFLIFYRIQCVGLENVPKEGAAIICSNHTDFKDPALIAVLSKRVLHFMAKKQLFENKLFAFVFKNLNAFPIDRESGRDIEAMRKAANVLKQGEVLGIFFEGRRIKEGEAKSAKAGVVLFALKSKAPIIPTYISGNYKLFSKLTVKYGDPVFFEGHYGQKVTQELLEKLTKVVSEKVEALSLV